MLNLRYLKKAAFLECGRDYPGDNERVSDKEFREREMNRLERKSTEE